MKLLTKALLKKLPALLSGQHIPCDDKICVVKFFHPMCQWTWYATEFGPKTGIFFGWVDGDFPEWGNFSLQEMEDLKVGGLGMERDLYFTPKPMHQIDNYKARGLTVPA